MIRGKREKDNTKVQGWAGSYASTIEEISNNEVKKAGEQRNINKKVCE
jgi:hypothetical protein